MNDMNNIGQNKTPAAQITAPSHLPKRALKPVQTNSG
jgi:hypothetical protein